MILQSNKKVERKKYLFSDELLFYYNNYSNYIDTLDLSEDTKEWRLKHIRGLLSYMQNLKININNLIPENIYNYLSTLNNYADRTKEHRAVCIRLFLDWLKENGIIKFNGKNILPKIKCNKNENLISTYNDKEITDLINSVNINQKNGKRDLSILLLLAYLGIRAKDVRYLKRESINWNDNRIIFIQNKNNNISSFIMPQNLRYALLDYLKNERPNVDNEYVFINESGNILSDSGIYEIVNKYFEKSNINISGKKHGTHALRHSLATSILNQSYSIYDVSSILGHSNIEDTKVYTKVNSKILKKISLEVPSCKN